MASNAHQSPVKSGVPNHADRHESEIIGSPQARFVRVTPPPRGRQFWRDWSRRIPEPIWTLLYRMAACLVAYFGATLAVVLLNAVVDDIDLTLVLGIESTIILALISFAEFMRSEVYDRLKTDADISDAVMFRLLAGPLEHLEAINHEVALEKTAVSFAGVVDRIADAVLASVMLILLGPLLVQIAIAIKLDSPGPVVFSMTRRGKGGRSFGMLKFRTMYASASNTYHPNLQRGDAHKIPFRISSDPRITRLGAFLRRYSLDQLPQLWNVLRGEMAIIGPRAPWRVNQDDIGIGYEWSVRPGLIDPANYETLTFDFHDRQLTNYDYTRRRGIRRDARILFKAFRAMLRGRE